MSRKFHKFTGDDPVVKPKTKTITPRITPELHQQLLQEAEDYNISLNLLCVEKLSQSVTWREKPNDEEKSEKGVQPVPANSGTDADPQHGATEQSG